MLEFFNDLSGLEKTFLVIACIFSLLFIWQFIAALIGLSAGEDFDLDHGGDVDGHFDMDDGDFDHDTTSGDFSGLKLLSLRSILAFGLLFSWSGFIFLHNDRVPVAKALIYSFAWGIVAMIIVSWVFYQMSKLQESGNMNMRACKGKEATVYVVIQPGQLGKVRIMIGEKVEFINARAVGNKEIAQGERVVVTKVIDNTTLEVDKI